MTTFRSLALLLVLTASSLPSHADLIVGTLGNSLDGTYNGFTQTSLAAFRFTTDNQGYLLTSIIGAIRRNGASGNIAPELRLYNNTGSDLPGSLLATLTTTPLPASTITDVSFVPSGAVTLAPNTTYWAGYRMTDATAAVVSLSNTATVTGPGIAYTNFAISNNTGSTWASTGGGSQIRFEVQGTVIPEPSALSLLAGLALAGYVARRSRRHTESSAS